MSQLREKYRNAYLLFYERDAIYDIVKAESDVLETYIPPTPDPTPPEKVG
jgi:hypothetical protein